MPFNLSEKVIDTLLDKLSTNDDFRELFKNNPRQALAAAGHAPAADASVMDGLWRCLAIEQLASKSAIRASRDLFRSQLQANATQVPFHFERTTRRGSSFVGTRAAHMSRSLSPRSPALRIK